MEKFHKIITELMGWALALLKLVLAIFLLAVAKITLRTNPEIAIPVLGLSAAMFLVWYFLPQIKQFLDIE